MAGAAYDTLTRHMKHRGTHPQDYDVIITGDLGQVGSDLLYDLFQRDGVSLREHHKDCGYDLRPRRPGRTRRRLRVRVLRFYDVWALLQADTGRRAETRSLLRDRRADVTYGRSAGREHSRDRALRGDIIGSRRLTR